MDLYWGLICISVSRPVSYIFPNLQISCLIPITNMHVQFKTEIKNLKKYHYFETDFCDVYKKLMFFWSLLCLNKSFL